MHLDPVALQERKERILETQRRGIESLLKRHKVRLIRGTGQIMGVGQVEVRKETGDQEIVSWDRLIIATGSSPLEIAVFPFDGKRILSSDDALSLREIPRSLVIVGGGVIGCEFASIFSAMGVEVTIVEALDRLLPLPSVDEDSSKILQREFKKRKIKFILRHVVAGVDRSHDGLSIRLSPSPFVEREEKKAAATEGLAAEKILVCVGRRPNTAGIGLETLGVETDERGWIRANGQMRTSVENVFAIGDVLGPEKIMLAHVASHEGIIAAENAMGGSEEMDYKAVPSAIFTHPEVADVGLTEAQAREGGKEVRTESFLFRNIGKPQVIGEISGQVKIVSEVKGGRILGVHMVGPHVTDLISEGTLAVQTGCSVSDLARTVHPHPTLSEVMQEVSYKALDKGIHG
ncbi:MAG: dihydrolipoyl dehydrogenase [Deltaproteobacteria bacterium]|nr:MAG: dihydrolipoyl dehydrogenase [Deltaproteobacteria bacterium]